MTGSIRYNMELDVELYILIKRLYKSHNYYLFIT